MLRFEDSTLWLDRFYCCTVIMLSCLCTPVLCVLGGGTTQNHNYSRFVMVVVVVAVVLTSVSTCTVCQFFFLSTKWLAGFFFTTISTHIVRVDTVLGSVILLYNTFVCLVSAPFETSCPTVRWNCTLSSPSLASDTVLQYKFTNVR